MRIWQQFVLALSLFCAAGGCVRSVQPVLLDSQIYVDPSLAGKWISKDGKDYVEIAANNDEGKTYSVVYVDKDGKKAPLVGRLGKVGDQIIAEFHPDDTMPNASDVYKAHLLPVYSFVIVRETKPRLVFTLIAPDWMKKYVAAHPEELATFSLDKDNLIVTAPTADLQAFILKHLKDPEALSEPAIMVRPGDPTTLPAEK